MGERAFLQSFEEFEGLDLIKSPLTASVNEASTLLNLRFNEGYSLTSRYGFQGIGFEKTGFVSGGTLSYLDPTTGETKNVLYGIAPELFYLRDATFTITRTGGATDWDWEFAPASDGSKYVFKIYQDDAQYAAIDVTPSTTIYTLIQAIDALANFSSTSTEKLAIVNGNQSSAVGTGTLTVDSGHTFAINDNLVFISTNSNLGTHLFGRRITATTATTLGWFAAYNLVATVTDNQVLGALGSLAAGITFKTVTIGSLPTSDTRTITFPTWDMSLGSNREMPPFLSFYRTGRTNVDGWSHASGVSSNGRAFIGSGFPQIASPAAATGYDYPRSFERFPRCFDGATHYRAGLPKAKIVSISSTGSGSPFLAGEKYKYKVAYRHKLRNGDVVLGQPSDEESHVISFDGDYISLTYFGPRFANATLYGTVTGTATTTTIPITISSAVLNVEPFEEIVLQDSASASNWVVRRVLSITTTSVVIDKAITTVNGSAAYINTFEGLNERGAFFASGQAANNTLTTGASHTFLVGDVFSAGRDQGENDEVALDRRVTAIGATSITFDGAPLATTTGDFYATAGMTAVIYRTTNGGNLYYKVTEMTLPIETPSSVGRTRFVFRDTVADADLGEQLIEPEIGKERDPPPAARIVLAHQGGVVYTGVSGEPNTISWSAIEEGPEAVPLASNYTDISSNIEGAISAAASDQSDSLLVFKPAAAYALSGDLNAGAFVARVLTEGDYGVSSQASVVNMGGAIIGIGLFGIKAFNSGGVVRGFGDNVNPAIANNASLELTQAVSFNDFANKSAVFFIPQRSSISSSVDADLTFAYDYEKEAWFERRYGTASGLYQMSGGAFMYENVPCWFSRGGYRGDTSNNGGFLYETNPARYFDTVSSFTTSSFYAPASLYCDFASVLKPTYVTEWIHLDEPSLKKLWLRIKLFRFRQSYETDEVTTNATYTVRVFKDFFEDVAIGSYSLNFTDGLAFERVLKLPKLNARAIKISISTSSMTTLHTFHLTGWEVAVDIGNYQKVDFLQNKGTPELPDP